MSEEGHPVAQTASMTGFSQKTRQAAGLRLGSNGRQVS